MSLPLRVVATLILIILLALLLGPATSVEHDVLGVDTVAHFFACGLVLWSFGGLTEVLQGLVGRDADIFDLVADTMGIATALLSWAWWRGFRPRTARSAQDKSA
jgi:VanZ family protein